MTVVRKNHHNALSPRSIRAYAFGATLIHRRTGEELHIDILTDTDTFCGVSAAIRRFYSIGEWGIYETWLIEDSNVQPTGDRDLQEWAA